MWSRDDLDLAVGLWGDPEVTKFIDNRGILSREQVEARLHQEIVTQSEHGFQYWPIFLLESGEHIGCTGLRPHDISGNILAIGFHIRSNHWRKGYASEAARTVMHYVLSDERQGQVRSYHQIGCNYRVYGGEAMATNTHSFISSVLQRTAILLTAAGLCLPAWSQDDMVLEEIIVFATKRAADVQDIAVAVTAITGDEIQNAGIKDVFDMQQYAPGLIVGQSQTAA